MIGSMTEAREILAAHKKGEIPDGWRYLGRGDFRYAYLSPSRVVYKIERGKSGQSNRGEFENASQFRCNRVVKAEIVVPKAWLYEIGRTDVLAMEYITGEKASPWHSLEECDCNGRFGDTCAMTQFLNLEFLTGLIDIHSGNAVFIPEQKKWALIDMGA